MGEIGTEPTGMGGTGVVAVSWIKALALGKRGRGDRSWIVRGFNELCPMYSKGA